MLELLIPVAALYALHKANLINLDFPLRQLVRWRRGYAYVNSTHSMLPARLNACWDGPGDPRLSGALLHTKFLPEIVAKSAIERTRRQHFHDPDAFDDYYAALGANPDLWHPGAARLECWQSLVAAGLMATGGWAGR